VEISEIVPVPAVGRIFRRTLRPGLADAAPSGRIRMDGLARWVQDLAYADVDDAQVSDESVWVVRRMRIRVERFPSFGEDVEALTFCSGYGRLWAERRVDFESASGRVQVTGQQMRRLRGVGGVAEEMGAGRPRVLQRADVQRGDRVDGPARDDRQSGPGGRQGDQRVQGRYDGAVARRRGVRAEALVHPLREW